MVPLPLPACGRGRYVGSGRREKNGGIQKKKKKDITDVIRCMQLVLDDLRDERQR